LPLHNFSAWKEQGNQNVLAKYTVDAFGWEYDPSNPLGNNMTSVVAWSIILGYTKLDVPCGTDN
jgi:hypothetical protein